MAEGFKKVPVMAWDFQNLFFLWVPTQKKCASYGMGFSKLFFVGVNQKRNKVPVMACPFQNLIFWGVPT